MSSENIISPKVRGRPKLDNPMNKTFKDYYADAEYRQKHLDKLNERVKCPNCSAFTAKNNLKRHQSSHLCTSKKNNNQLTKELRDLKKQIKNRK